MPQTQEPALVCPGTLPVWAAVLEQVVHDAQSTFQMGDGLVFAVVYAKNSSHVYKDL